MAIYNKGLSRENSTDDGKEIFSLTSKEEEKYKVRRIVITDVETNPLVMEIWVERDRIGENIPLEVASDLAPERVIDLDVDIPVGHTFSVKIKPQKKTLALKSVNINTAGKSELERLPRIGPSTAKKIIALRREMSGFKKIDDLLKVKGIGPKTLDKIRPYLFLKEKGNAAK